MLDKPLRWAGSPTCSKWRAKSAEVTDKEIYSVVEEEESRSYNEFLYFKDTSMNKIASILHHHDNEIFFKVDDVEVFKNLLPLQSAYKQLEKRLDSSLIAFCHEDSFQFIEQSDENILEDTLNLHSLVNAVHQAFAEHRPLLITPDTVWMAIAIRFCSTYQ